MGPRGHGLVHEFETQLQQGAALRVHATWVGTIEAKTLHCSKTHGQVLRDHRVKILALLKTMT